MMIIENPFRYSGHLDPREDADIMIERKEKLNIVLTGILDKKYYAIIGPRQTGKTTFIWQLINKINEDELHTHESIYITLEGLKKGLDKFYFNIAREIIRDLSNKYFIQPDSIETSYKKVKDNQDFKLFLSDLSRARFRNKAEGWNIVEDGKNLKFVIFIDEVGIFIDRPTWKPNELAIEFFSTVRAIHEKRSSSGEGFESYNFILSGAMELGKLTHGLNSPFNIADTIKIEDFNEEAAILMVERAFEKIGVEYYPSFLQDLFGATSGHPCFVQKLCAKIVEKLNLENREDIQLHDLETQINQLINEGDNTLRCTWDKVKDHENLRILKRILNGEKIKYSEYDELCYELRLAGAIVRDENGFCKIRNPIYKRFFLTQHELNAPN